MKLILAVDRNFAIGKDGRLLFSLKKISPISRTPRWAAFSSWDARLLIPCRAS